MNEVYENQIKFIGEQDGNIEREFKTKLNNLFVQSRNTMRAYLVKVKYTGRKELNVALCIKSNNEGSTSILNECEHIFQSLFSSGQHLDMIYITDTEEQEIRQLCCPFYTSDTFQISTPDFYLFSSESYDLSDTSRSCYKNKRLYGDHIDGYILCDIEPVIIGQSFGLGSKDINQIIIASRFEGMSLFPVTEWPTYIYVTRPLIQDIEYKNNIVKTDYELIAWAEIYKKKLDILV